MNEILLPHRNLPTPKTARQADTTTHLYGPDGELLRESPTTLLTGEESAILRTYFHMMMTAGLEIELFCRSCGSSHREDKAQFDISDDQIVIACNCRALFNNGFTPLGMFEKVSLLAETTVRPFPGTVEQRAISEAAAGLLRRWKKFLIEYGLQEALRCNACYEANRSDGCDAQVLSSSIGMWCRCRRATYSGTS